MARFVNLDDILGCLQDTLDEAQSKSPNKATFEKSVATYAFRQFMKILAASPHIVIEESEWVHEGDFNWSCGRCHTKFVSEQVPHWQFCPHCGSHNDSWDELATNKKK